MKELLLHEYRYRQRILAAPPASPERSALISDMYAGTYRIQAQIKAALGSGWQYCHDSIDKTRHAESISRLRRPGRCLEFGCGAGFLCLALAKLGWSTHGIDVVAGPEWDRIISQGAGRVRLEVREFTTNAPADGSFDLAILDNCLEHVAPGDYERTLDLAFQSLVPGGWILVSIPNPLSGPHDCTINFRKKGEPALGGHFSERTLLRLSVDLYRAGFRAFRTVIRGGFFAGAKRGWTRTWFVKAIASELVFRMLPPNLWSDDLFEFFVPYCLAAQRPR